MTVLKMLGYFMTFNCYLGLPKKYYINICQNFPRHKGYKKCQTIVKTYFKLIAFWQY